MLPKLLCLDVTCQGPPFQCTWYSSFCPLLLLESKLVSFQFFLHPLCPDAKNRTWKNKWIALKIGFKGVAFNSISKGYTKLATILVSKLEHWFFCEVSETSVQINIMQDKTVPPPKLSPPTTCHFCRYKNTFLPCLHTFWLVILCVVNEGVILRLK